MGVLLFVGSWGNGWLERPRRAADLGGLVLRAARGVLPILAAAMLPTLAAGDAGAQTPANQDPQFPDSGAVSRSIDENTAAGMDIGAPIAATDPDGDSLTYTLGGDDADSFDIVESSGQLLTKASLDHETTSMYSLTVSVSDSKDADGNPDTAIDDTIEVGVRVTNIEEAGTVTLSPASARMGTVVRARVSDPDGIETTVTWRWASSDDGVDWSNISGATKSSYRPRQGQLGKRLRATADYRDGHSSERQAAAELVGMVAAPEQLPGLSVHTLVSGLSIPWGLTFAPDGTMLFTEREGRIRALLVDGTVNTVTADLSDLYKLHEVGLMAIIVDPGFANNRRFYTCQGHTGSIVQVIAWTIDDAYTEATRTRDPLVGDIPADVRHSGCRLRFGPAGNLWIATGDGLTGTSPQDLSSLGGKILRVDASTGAGATGNPFTDAPLVYTYGHRNPQGLALRPGTSQMWAVEHGPLYDDEINLLEPGGNYGWDPVPRYNERVPMTDLEKYPDAVEAKWSSGPQRLATSGGVFIEGAEWGVWEGRLAVASLKDETLRLFEFDAEGTLQSEVIVTELNSRKARFRTPMMGPDGALYLTTSEGDDEDKILRIAPHQPPVFGTETVTAEVAENSPIGTVVATVAAYDPNYDTLTYSLGGPDAPSFAVTDTDSGGRVTLATIPDYENEPLFEVELTATDPQATSDSTTLIIEITDVDERPSLSGYPSARFDENATATVATFTAVDPENASIRWSVEGDDKWDFTINDGALRFSAIPDFEHPADSNGDNIYRITVQASDGAYTVSHAFTVTVANLDEEGALALSPQPPQVGRALTATLSDPDSIVGTVEWLWERSADTSTWHAVSGAEGSRYTPAAPDRDHWLRVTATYADSHGSGKSLEAVTVGAVPSLPIRSGGGGGGGGDGGEPESPPDASESFSDVPDGVWYEQAVSWMARHGITRGCTDTTFCPEHPHTRQQFVTFLWRAASQPEAPYLGSEAFSDVGEGAYSDRAIGWAAANGVTVGCTPGGFGDPGWMFCPDEAVTRAQVAVLLYRYVQADHAADGQTNDDVAVDHFAVDAVGWLTHFDVVPGCAPGLFCPDRDATRAEAAAFIHGVATRPHIWGDNNTAFTPLLN